MIARGFKPVGWVAAVAGAALGCYMLSLNVAAERAELAKIERQILTAKQDIRSLQTELGTRGRLAQLESWNSDVLALSAPASRQFLQNEFRLASYASPQEDLGQNMAKVRMASATIDQTAPAAKPAVVSGFAADDDQGARPLVRRASLVLGGDEDIARQPAFRPATVTMKPAPQPDKKRASIPIKTATATLPAKRAAADAPRKNGNATAPIGSTGLIGADVLSEIGATSRAEVKSAGAGTR